MVSALIITLEFTEENRDINTIYRIIIKSLQGLDHNWYKNISPNIKNIIELGAKSNLRTDIEERIWTLKKHLFGQSKGYEFIENFNQAN